MKLAKRQILTLKQQTEDIADNYKKFAKATPSADDFKNAAFEANKVVKAVDKLHILNFVNSIMAVVFIGVVVFCGWHSYNAHQSAEKAEQAAQAATNGLYNKEGYAVLDGARSSKAAIEAAKTKK